MDIPMCSAGMMMSDPDFPVDAPETPDSTPAATPTKIPEPGTIETEFDVAIPGVILPQEQWAKTALKRWPKERPLDLEAMFGRSGPVVIDIGCGNGRFTLWSALQRPDHLHLAVDILPVVVRYATRRANQRGLSNVRVGVIGGRELVQYHFAPGSIAEIHCYHPQPYYDPEQIHQRLITPEFLADVHRVLQPGGRCYLQTDNPAYAKYMRSIFGEFFTVTELPGRWPETPEGRTRREILAIRENLPIYRAVGVKREDLSPEQIAERVKQLPRPDFDADRSLAKYDLLETGRDRSQPPQKPQQRRPFKPKRPHRPKRPKRSK